MSLILFAGLGTHVSHLVRMSWNSKSLILFAGLGTECLSSCSNVLEQIVSHLVRLSWNADSLILFDAISIQTSRVNDRPAPHDTPLPRRDVSRDARENLGSAGRHGRGLAAHPLRLEH